MNQLTINSFICLFQHIIFLNNRLCVLSYVGRVFLKLKDESLIWFNIHPFISNQIIALFIPPKIFPDYIGDHNC